MSNKIPAYATAKTQIAFGISEIETRIRNDSNNALMLWESNAYNKHEIKGLAYQFEQKVLKDPNVAINFYAKQLLRRANAATKEHAKKVRNGGWTGQSMANAGYVAMMMLHEFFTVENGVPEEYCLETVLKAIRDRLVQLSTSNYQD